MVIASAAIWWPAPAHAARIKEFASVQGVRSNQLVGYGLVVGLDGTGDQSTSAPFTTQSISAMLQQMGVTVPQGTTMQLKNVAAVLVTAAVAGVCATWPGDRCQCLVARQCEEPAWRHADRHAAERRRRPDLCGRPGQPDRQRRWRRGRRQPGADQPPERRPHPRRRHRRARGADAAATKATACSST